MCLLRLALQRLMQGSSDTLRTPPRQRKVCSQARSIHVGGEVAVVPCDGVEQRQVGG